MEKGDNVTELYIMKIRRLEKDNRELRKENEKLSKILEGIKVYFTPAFY